MRASIRAAVLSGLLVLAASSQPAAAETAAGCTFVLGFAGLAQMLPQQVGVCADNESHNPQNGDALQHTSTGGLLVWRKADNWTAFTDGYHTWVNGPNGLQERLNTDRFPWEAPSPSAAPSASASPSPSPSASPAAPAAPGQPNPADVALVSVPPGAPPMSSLSVDQQLACIHLVQQMIQTEKTNAPVPMSADSFSCPYFTMPNWQGPA